ncbi:MAG: PH domain-containing protein [Haloplanus sp.]
MATRPDWLSLDADETVVWRGGPRIRRVLPTAAAATLWIALLVVAVVVRPRVVTATIPTAALVGVAVLAALPALGAVALAYLRTTNVDYLLTDRNVYRKAGILSTHVTRVGLSTVQSTALSKDFWGAAFDYGTIAISTAGSEGVDLRFADLDDPDPVRAEIRRLTGKHRTEGETSALDAATADTLRNEFGALHAAADRLERAVSET